MNVMAEAHKETKLLIQSMSAEGQAQVKSEKLYGRMFSINLKRFHKEYKAMQAEQNAMILHFQTTIDKYLEAAKTLQGWVQVFPESMVLVNAEVGAVANLKNVPTYDRIQDARRFDGRVGNKAGEECRTMGIQTYISRQIGALEQQIRDIKSA